jgi:quinol monooxygenase YgiN
MANNSSVPLKPVKTLKCVWQLFLAQFGLLGVIFVAAIVLPALWLAGGQDKSHPVVAAVKPKLTDPNHPFTMLVRLKAGEGAADRIIEAFRPAIKASREESGCIAYDLNREGADGNSFLVYERWKNLAALEAHLKTPHIKKLLADLEANLTVHPRSTSCFRLLSKILASENSKSRSDTNWYCLYNERV